MFISRDPCLLHLFLSYHARRFAKFMWPFLFKRTICLSLRVYVRATDVHLFNKFRVRLIFYPRFIPAEAFHFRVTSFFFCLCPAGYSTVFSSAVLFSRQRPCFPPFFLPSHFLLSKSSAERSLAPSLLFSITHTGCFFLLLAPFFSVTLDHCHSLSLSISSHLLQVDTVEVTLSQARPLTI